MLPAPLIGDVARALDLRFAVQQIDHDSPELIGIHRPREVIVEPRRSRRLLVVVLPVNAISTMLRPHASWRMRRATSCGGPLDVLR
jgi:hypothetical protein